MKQTVTKRPMINEEKTRRLLFFVYPCLYETTGRRDSLLNPYNPAATDFNIGFLIKE